MGKSQSDSAEVEREYDWESITPGVAILETLAILEHGDTDKIGDVLETPLVEYIDTDGLDRVVTSTQSLTMEFSVDQYTVRIQDNTVSILVTKPVNSGP